MSEDSAQLVVEFKRYAGLIEQMLAAAPAFLPTSEDDVTVQVERGGALAQAVTNATGHEFPLFDRLNVPDPAEIRIVDRLGHQRPIYRPLLIYAWLLSYKILYEMVDRETFGRWDESLRAWCDLLEATLTTRGASITESAWMGLALHVAGKVLVRDAWTDLAADTFGRLARGQSETGEFLTRSPADHPEVTWFDELAVLHAAASYAVQTEDRPLAAAVRRATMFHLNQTQPDHATAQPWGIFAFIWNKETRPLADGMLHAVSMQQPIDGVSLILLVDALYCLRLYV